MLTGNPSGGTTTLPPAGPLLPTGEPQFFSRRVSSWFFGDGAQLANDLAAAFPLVSSRIIPLDRVLGNPLADRQNGGAFGFRVGRRITNRLTAEFNFDYTLTPWEVPSATASGIEATAGSFQVLFDEIFDPLRSPGAGANVSSSSVVQDGDGSQIVVTGTPEEIAQNEKSQKKLAIVQKIGSIWVCSTPHLDSVVSCSTPMLRPMRPTPHAAPGRSAASTATSVPGSKMNGRCARR